MLDFTHIPNGVDKQIFYAQSGSNSWQTWRKPRGAKVVYIMCIGGGGGGGGGRTQSVTLSGGGGGASGGITKLIIPSSAIPDTLYVRPGIGGDGGTSPSGDVDALNGSSGSNSIVSLLPSSSYNLIICAAPGGNGGRGGLNSGPAPGAGSTNAYTPTNALFMGLGTYYSEPTITGRKASDATDTTIYALSQSIVTGGCGGASVVTYPGGNILASSVFLLSNVVSFAQASGLPGEDGYGMFSPIFCGTGGAGGSGNNTVGSVPGGGGGDGFYGCGGGGGGAYGATTPTNNGGTGGRGGDGLVFIITST